MIQSLPYPVGPALPSAAASIKADKAALGPSSPPDVWPAEQVSSTWLWRFLAVAVVLVCGSVARSADGSTPPNVVLILTDDQGYADVGCYGAKGIVTPNLDRLAREGVRFTDFYVAQGVCSASRAALLTGCYPNRIGILNALSPKSTIGIGARERTIADLLKARGYATAIYGKWHLGHLPPYLPTRHGFDDYYGLPYSNDMGPNPAEERDYPDLPLYERERVIAINPDQSRLTADYTERAVRFIVNNKNKPFFLYLPHTMPHVPLAASARFKGTSQRGLYGDVIQELDWSVGQVLAALKENGLDDRTLVLFTSDNGPWLSYGDHGGSAGLLREGKATTWEGGVREPFLARWPGHIPAGTVCREPAMTIDILPTIVGLTGAKLPELPIDGKDIWPLLARQPGAKNPHEAYYFYWQNHLQAVRAGRWKLHLTHSYRTLEGAAGQGGKAGTYRQTRTGMVLYDLQEDPGETKDVAGNHPDIVKHLKSLAAKERAELGDSETWQTGSGVRSPVRQ
jgi:arylsulfatase A